MPLPIWAAFWRRSKPYGVQLSRKTPHALLGEASVHASLIRGGRELSSYPDTCELDIERRTLPGEPWHSVRRELEPFMEALARDPQFQAEMEMRLSQPAFEIREPETLRQKLKAAIERVRGSCSFVGMTAWTDSALLTEAGIPAVVFGPGGAGLHGLKEYGDTRQICVRRDAFVDFAKNW